MAHLGFLTLDYMGHLFPMSSLALCLKSRGHRVTFFSLADSEAFLTNAGLGCIVFGRDCLPPGSTKNFSDELSKLHGVRGVQFTVKRFCYEVEVQLQELAAAIRTAEIEALIIDQFFQS